MAKLNITAQFKRAMTNVATFADHSLQHADDEDKHNYLKALSLMIYADKSRTEAQSTYFGTLFRTLKPGTVSLQSMFSFAENFEVDDLHQIMTTLKKDDATGVAFLLDMVMLAAVDGQISDEAKGLIAVCRNLLGWDHTIYNRWYSYCAVIASGVQSDACFAPCLKALPANVVAHVLQHRGLQQEPLQSFTGAWSRQNISCTFCEDISIIQLTDFLPAPESKYVASRVNAALASATVFTSHPLKDADLEDKMNYLKVLSLVMVADEKIVAAECDYFAVVTRTLVNADMVQVLLDYAKNPDLSEITALIETMAKSENYKHSLIVDATMLASVDGDFHKNEKEFIAQLREFLNWDNETFTRAFNLAGAIIEQGEGEVLNRLLCDVPDGLADHLLEYRGVIGTAQIIGTFMLGIRFKTPPDMVYGKLVKCEQISTKPITIGQFYPFLRYLMCLNECQASGGVLQLTSGSELVALDANGFNMTKGNLYLEPKHKNKQLRGISPYAAELFCRWLSRGGKNCCIPKISCGSNHYVSEFVSEGKLLVKLGVKSYLFHSSRSGSFGAFGIIENTINMSKLKILDENKICPDAKLYIVICKD